MRLPYQLLFLYFIIQLAYSEKVIEIQSFQSKGSCIQENKIFDVMFQSTYTDISGNDYFYLPLKSPSGAKMTCTLNPQSGLLPCNLNIFTYPIINETVAFDTSVTQVDDIKIVWNLENPTTDQVTCSLAYTHKFTVESHSEVKECTGNYNAFDILGTYESLSNHNQLSLLAEDIQVSFFIEKDGKSESAICFLYENEKRMQCLVEGKGKAKFFKTTASGESETPLILMDQSFEIELKDCSSKSSSKFNKFSSLGLFLILVLL